jgi:hypothetical protein
VGPTKLCCLLSSGRWIVPGVISAMLGRGLDPASMLYFVVVGIKETGCEMGARYGSGGCWVDWNTRKYRFLDDAACFVVLGCAKVE